jgi:hypothetical protein
VQGVAQVHSTDDVCPTCIAVVLLQTRVKEQRKKAFDEAQHKALADASAALQAATAAAAASSGGGKQPEPAPAAAGTLTPQDVAGAVASSGSSSPGKPPAAASGSNGGSSKPGKAELEARVAYLQEAAKNYDDPGTTQAHIWGPGPSTLFMSVQG